MLFPALGVLGKSGTSRAARVRHDIKRAPLSRDEKESIQSGNVLAGVGLGTIVGGFLGGLPGAFVGGVVGGILGHGSDPEAG